MEKLIFPGHIGKLEYIMPALQVYVEADDWVKTADYIEREFNILKANGVETEMKDDKTDYTKDAELPRYFGFVERQTPGDVKSDCRITKLGKLFYDSVKKNNQSGINEAIMTALETITFGKNNDGCPGSNTKLEAPNILLIASLMLDGVTRQEYAGVLYEMLNNKAPMVSALVKIKLLRDTNSPINDKVRVDNKVIPFLVNVNFLKEEGSMIKLTDLVKQNFQERISKLPPTNELENIFPVIKDVNSQTNTSELFPYLTAIRTKPFLLLAGISGTGKSRIVRKLAQATNDIDFDKNYDGDDRWKMHSPTNFCLIQVKPNWHNSMDVVGFKSNIGGAHYEFTPFIEFIAKAWHYPDTPFFLCLDEMNLAPVEEYFAEFLSAIESRSFNKDGEYETDPIVNPFNSFGLDVCGLMIAHLVDKNLDSDRKIENMFRTKGLSLPKNLIVMGTVNMDETTFSFSRKVLDRAMSIEMNEVNYDAFLTGETEEDVPLLTDCNNLLVERPINAQDVKHDIDADKIIGYLKSVNALLDGTPFKLGYRAANEAFLYVSASKMFGSDDLDSALDKFTVMKILSRIEGDDSKLKTKSGEDLLPALLDLLNAQFGEDGKSISVHKLTEMNDILVRDHFVSFWG